MLSTQDEFLYSLMIRICAATHDAEKALNIFDQMREEGFIEIAETYNSLIFALASRSNYARRAVDLYRKMVQRKVVPDRHTFTGVLKATAHTGDVPTACEILETMRTLNIDMTVHTYNGLIRTYAGACLVPDVDQGHIEVYIKDAWELLDQMRDKEIDINIYVLNSMVLLHANALCTQELHERVLPLFERYKIEPDVYTYQHLIEHYEKIQEVDTAIDLYDRMITNGLEPNAHTLNTYLH